MVFVAPKLSAEQALVVVVSVWVLARRNKRRFKRIMAALQQHNCFRIRDAAPPVDRSRSFDAMLNDATVKVRYRFTISELSVLAVKLQLPDDGVVTTSGDRVNRVEELAMLCRRLSEPSKLLTVASEFGRGMAPYSRVVKATAQLIVNHHRDLVYFNYNLVRLRINAYAAAIHAKGAPLRTCWAFIDGTKQYVARPSARADPASKYENLQRSLYNGHPRRHCFNWQSVQAPDGILVSLYGPLEGRRHDSTMLNLSGLIEKMEEDQSGIFCGKLIYGDPAYGCSRFVCCPSIDTSPAAAAFNREMSSVRESVEWGFGRVKTQWEFLNWDKKNRARQTAVGNLFFVGVLLTNCHTCMQPLGNQISMFFGLLPPTLDEYLGIMDV